jgi:uncharacterized protein involved in response to NO
MTETEPDTPTYRGPAFLSYGFRPFFLSAALFAGLAVPAWVLILSGAGQSSFFYPPREWRVHEMLFGFLPAVMTGFLLTAIPSWTDRPPVRGMSLLLMLLVWLAGRLAIAVPWPAPLMIGVVDGAFLILLATIVWREIAAAKAWDRSPIGVLIGLYASANILFHVLALRGAETDIPERMAFAFIMLLLTLIGGRVTPTFTGEYLASQGIAGQSPSFSPIDRLSIALAGMAAVAWIAQPQATATGWILAAAGAANSVRLSRWRGWVTWHEPLVLILHVGYGWLALSMLALGTAILGLGLRPADAVHALTTGAVGSMTLAIMTRATLGHTGRPRHADSMTVMIYFLVNLGALVRVFGTTTGLSTNLLLSLAAAAWSSAYLLFAIIYGPFLSRPGLDE